jgi:hypothetical protein
MKYPEDEKSLLFILLSKLQLRNPNHSKYYTWIKSSNHTRSLHTTNFPWLSSTENSTELKCTQVKVKVTLWLSQSVNLGVKPNLGLMTRYLLLFDSYSLVIVRRPLWREDGLKCLSLSLSLSLMLRPTVSRPVCLGIKHSSAAYDQIFISVRNTEYVWQVTFLIPWGALSVCAAGPCQRSLSRVLVPWELRPYFTVSDLRRPFSSPPTTRRVTVEVFDPASTRVWSACWCYSRYIASARITHRKPSSIVA